MGIAAPCGPVILGGTATLPYVGAVQPALSVSDLSDRSRIIFRELVDSFLTTGTPVGSRTLSKLGSLGLSPASIRNVMQDLEGRACWRRRTPPPAASPPNAACGCSSMA